MADYMSGVTHAGVRVQNWAGDFECSVCRRKRLPASEFSKKMQEKKLQGAPVKCKACVEAAAQVEQAASKTQGAVCSSCKQTRSISKQQLRKGPDRQRCSACVERAQRDEAQASQDKKEKALKDAKHAVAVAATPAEKLKANAKLAALEGEMVTGLKPKVIGRRSRR